MSTKPNPKNIKTVSASALLRTPLGGAQKLPLLTVAIGSSLEKTDVSEIKGMLLAISNAQGLSSDKTSALYRAIRQVLAEDIDLSSDCKECDEGFSPLGSTLNGILNAIEVQNEFLQSILDNIRL